MKNITNTLFQSIIVLFGVCLVAPSFANDAVVPKPDPITVQISSAKMEPIPDSVNALGTIKAVHAADLSFSTAGHINYLYFDNGAEVKKGDVLATLDDTDLQAELASQKAKLEAAKGNYERTQLIKDSGVFSKQQLLQINSDYETAKSEYAAVLSQMRNLKLLAPFSGTLGSMKFSVGAYIGAGQTLVNLVELDPLKVEYNLSQEYKNKVKKGQGIYLSTNMYPDKKFKGSVTYMAPTINPATGRFDLEAIFDNKEYLLSPGQSINVKQVLGQSKPQLVVPQTAVVLRDQQSFVYTVSNNVASQVEVTIGENTNDGKTVIKEGLKVGDNVVIAGTQKLTDTAPVQIQPPSLKHEKTPLGQSNVPSQATATMNVPSQATATMNVPSQATATMNVPSQATATMNVPSQATATMNVPSTGIPSTESRMKIVPLQTAPVRDGMGQLMGVESTPSSATSTTSEAKDPVSKQTTASQSAAAAQNSAVAKSATNSADATPVAPSSASGS